MCPKLGSSEIIQIILQATQLFCIYVGEKLFLVLCTCLNQHEQNSKFSGIFRAELLQFWLLGIKILHFDSRLRDYVS